MEKENTFITEHNMTTYTSYQFLTYLTTDTKVERKDVHILRAGVETASIPIFFLSSFLSKQGDTCQNRKRVPFIALPLPFYSGLISPFDMKVHQQSMCLYQTEYLKTSLGSRNKLSTSKTTSSSGLREKAVSAQEFANSISLSSSAIFQDAHVPQKKVSRMTNAQ